MSDLGVVDPIRMPAPVGAAARVIRRGPLVARIFIGLLAVNLVLQWLKIASPGLVFNRGVISIFSALVPTDLFIVLPAIVVLRRPTAPIDTPWVVRGAAFLAAVTFAVGLVQPVLIRVVTQDPFGDPGNSLPLNTVAIVRALLSAWAMVLLATGLGRLNPKAPAPIAAGLGNLTALAILASLLAQLVVQLGTSSGGFAVGGGVVSVVSQVISGIAIAYLLRAAARGFDDPSRPELGTRIATAGVLTWALASLFAAAFGIVELLLVPTGSTLLPSQATIDAFNTFAIALVVMQEIGTLLFVVAFALGLADPLRPLAKDWEAAAARA